MWHCCLYILIFRYYPIDHRRRMLPSNLIIAIIFTWIWYYFCNSDIFLLQTFKCTLQEIPSPAVDKGMLAACAWMIKIPTKKMLPAWMIKVPAKLHFSLETGAAVSFKSGQLFQRAEKKFAETYFLKIVLSPHLRAWLACLADQTPIWSFRRFTYWDFLLIILCW